MGASSQAEGVRALAGPAVAGAGLVLEDLQITPAGRRRVLRVTVDLPADAVGGVPLDAVAQASQALSAALDASDVMGGAPYVLEVSSPGADRPLTEPRHWSRARGRLVRARLRPGEGSAEHPAEHEGRLAEVDDDGIGFADGSRFGWAAVAGGRVVLEFDRPDGAPGEDGDLDVEDEDEDDDAGQEG